MKILIYLNNSVGHGHTNRILALVMGMKKVDPRIDFLIVGGTDIPQVFLQNGIEIIKLPSTRILFDSKGQKLVPRHLKIKLSELMKMRQELIKTTYEQFNPDTILVEHNITGQAWELIPILIDKWRNPDKFNLFWITRGIIDSPQRLNVPYSRQQHLVESINVIDLYDKIFVMDSKKNIDYEKDYHFDKETCKKIVYSGMITTKDKHELKPSQTQRKLGLKNKKLILVSLGRIGEINKIISFVVKTARTFEGEYLIKIQADPYLNKSTLDKIIKIIKDQPNIIISSFAPDLVEEINIAELVITRAGYNTVAEILLTNSKAILFPEVGRTEEEPYRSKKLNQYKNIVSFDERKVTYKEFEKALFRLLKAKKKNYRVTFDNEKIAREMLRMTRGNK